MRVAVLDAGSMGHGIAQVSAQAGHGVVLRDVEEALVADGLAGIRANLQGGVDRDKLPEAEMEAALDRVDGTTDLAAAVGDVDLVVEAVPEDVDLKQSVFGDVEAHAPTDAVFASNTSSLSVTALASTLDRPDRMVGLHFFNDKPRATVRGAVDPAAPDGPCRGRHRRADERRDEGIRRRLRSRPGQGGRRRA